MQIIRLTESVAHKGKEEMHAKCWMETTRNETKE